MSNEPNGRPTPPGVVNEVSCPACAAPRYMGCWTPATGHDLAWTHDERIAVANLHHQDVSAPS